ncbi:MAG: hypothetical protein D6712_09220 [Chloroflexi bacterium]|nr:MAG: hypothetical protein D6712_09220 [Chloroflexota bacterium]
MNLSSEAITAFVDDLAAVDSGERAYNHYAPTNANNDLRRANLSLYLQHMAERQPDTILIAEAPGYRGCRLTGLPMTSRRVMLEGIEALAMFGEARGYCNPQDTGFERIYNEQSATILWGTLAEIGAVPFIWSTFPFHPHQPQKPLSNRRPTKTEIALGVPFIKRLLAMYRFSRVIAVGNVAYETLNKLGIAVTAKVRHPAQGGKNDFVAGLKALF